MADTTATSGEMDKMHQEGIDHIKSALADKQTEEPAAAAGGASTAGTAEGTTPATATTATSEATSAAPITAAEPPASNPGAADKTGGIAKDAGGLSGAAHKDIPNPATKDKRKSLFGSVKGYLGLDKKGDEQKQASDGTYVGAATAAATGAVAAVTGTVASLTGSNNHESPATSKAATATEPGVSDSSKAPVLTSQHYPESSTAATATGGTNMDKNADSAPASAPATDVVDKTHGNTKTEEQNPPGEPNSADAGPANTGSTSGDGDHKPPKPVDNVAPENKSAIPSAGGEKLGEKHWGESKIVPDDPGKKQESNVASKEGQPSKEVADNTAKNTGGATSAGPSTSAEKTDPHAKGEKKGKFLDKLKEKLPIGKKKGDKA